MAVSLYSHFTFERAETLQITGCPEEFQNEGNLVYVSFVDALREWGEEPFPVKLDISTEVPVARGLGSSSTCVVAGIMAAAALTGHTVDRAELVRIATAVEGHPDNVAPAILGGAVCSFTPEGGLPRCLRYDVSDRLRFITVIPPYEVHTSEARKVVPQEVPLSSAVWQMGRIAGMTRGLETGDLGLIADANDDRLQEPYRRALIPDYDAIRATCLDGGAGTLSIFDPDRPSWPSRTTPSWRSSSRFACARRSPPARRTSSPATRKAPRSSICSEEWGRGGDAPGPLDAPQSTFADRDPRRPR